MAFELWVWIRWICSDNFHRPLVDASSVPALTKHVIFVTQIVSPIICAGIVLKYLVIPIFRSRKLSTDGMLVITWFFLWFQDPMGNFANTQLYYSSYWVSMGSWTTGSFPGWINPLGSHLPEPILVMGLGYLWLGFTAGVLASWVMAKIRLYSPNVSNILLVMVAFLLCMSLDIVAEVALAWAGTFAWPGAIKGLSLFPGMPYQFPLYEGVLFGATIALGGIIRFYRDDSGQTFVENGIKRLSWPQGALTSVKFFALFGVLHLFMAVVYSLPMNFFGLHSDPFLRYPSHLENGMQMTRQDG